MQISRTIEQLKDHLRKNVVENRSGCLEWQLGADKGRMGYGVVNHLGKRHYAHRLAYSLFMGDLPNNLSVCHKCDNPKCINVDHLFLGTRGDNNRDRTAKGRSSNQYKGVTHCKRGHEFTQENAVITKLGSRACKACERERTVLRKQGLRK